MFDAAVPRRFSRCEIALLVLTTVFYAVMTGHLRTFDLDNIWFLSFSHGFWREGVVTDGLMQQSFPAGMGGVVAFGKLAALVQGIVLSTVGWSLMAANLLSAAFVSAAVWLLADMCRRQGYSANLTMCFVVLIAWTEPFVLAAQEARYEFLTVFLLALALWMAARNWVMAAAFVAFVSVEVEPIAVVPCLAVVTTLLVQQRGKVRTRATLLRIAAGGSAAVAVYAGLHPHIMDVIRTADWHTAGRRSFPTGFVGGYFFYSKRHLVDLAVLLTALCVAVRSRRDVLRHWAAWGALTVVVTAAALRWENPHYFGLAMPFLALFAAEALYTERRWKWIVGGVLVVMLPQYAYRYVFSVRRSPAFSQQDERQVSAALERVASGMGKSAGDVQILGNVHVWFARPGKYLALDRHLLGPGVVERPDVVLCFETKLDAVLPPGSNPETTCSELDGLRTPQERITVHGRQLEVISQAGAPVSAKMLPWMVEAMRRAGAIGITRALPKPRPLNIAMMRFY